MNEPALRFLFYYCQASLPVAFKQRSAELQELSRLEGIRSPAPFSLSSTQFFSQYARKGVREFSSSLGAARGDEDGRREVSRARRVVGGRARGRRAQYHRKIRWEECGILPTSDSLPEVWRSCVGPRKHVQPF